MTPKQVSVLIYAGALVFWGVIAGRIYVPLQRGYALQATLQMPGTSRISSVSAVAYSDATTISIYGVIGLGVATALLGLLRYHKAELIGYATIAAALIVYILVTREYGLIGTPISFWFVAFPAVVAAMTRYFGRLIGEER